MEEQNDEGSEKADERVIDDKDRGDESAGVEQDVRRETAVLLALVYCGS